MEPVPPNFQSPYAPRQPAPLRAMLAWWAIFPVAVCLIVQGVVDWKHAQAHAGGPQLVVSYFVGMLLAPLIIAFVIAWIAYRLSGRSQLVGTTAFIAVLAVGAFGALERAIVDPRLVAPSDGKAKVLKLDDFSVESLPGWLSLPPDHENQLVNLLLNSRDWRTADGRIEIDVGKPVLPTAKQLAKSMAGRNGRVWPEPISLDGVESVRADLPSSDISEPRFGVFVYRNGNAYLIFASQSAGHDVSADFEHVLKTWRWSGGRK